MRKKLIIIGALLAAVLLLGACTPGPEQPTHEKLSFQLSSDTTPGNTDEYDTHSFNIYLEPEQELMLDFYAEGAAVMFSAITPSEEMLGYETSDGRAGNIKDTGLGRLQEKKIKAAAEGHFRFTAPEAGFYIMSVKSATPKGEINVVIEYCIQ